VSFSWEPFGMARRDVEIAGESALPRQPRRALAVVTCMDARIDPLAHFGLRIGDAHVLRNAGAEVTDDVERSLALSRDAAGTRDAWLVGHTDCVAHGGSDERVEASLRRSAERVASLGLRVRVFRYDLERGHMVELQTPHHEEIR
jgi:carbonic anhydrase